MSGHSHYATIKRQKGVKDAAKGKIFSRHAKAIAIAVKSGGGADPEKNSKLRFAIEQAKSDNMPKVNIDRILSKAEDAGDLTEMTYEGFSVEGVGVLVLVATDNKNRTAQEIKNIFERGGGSMAGPGAVSYNFEQKGFLLIEKAADAESQMLSLIDLGIDDIEELDSELEAYVSPVDTARIKEKIEELGFTVKRMQLTMKPKNVVVVEDENKAGKALKLLDALEDCDDVQEVYTNIDIPENVLEKIK